MEGYVQNFPHPEHSEVVLTCLGFDRAARDEPRMANRWHHSRNSQWLMTQLGKVMVTWSSLDCLTLEPLFGGHAFNPKGFGQCSFSTGVELGGLAILINTHRLVMSAVWIGTHCPMADVLLFDLFLFRIAPFFTRCADASCSEASMWWVQLQIARGDRSFTSPPPVRTPQHGA